MATHLRYRNDEYSTSLASPCGTDYSERSQKVDTRTMLTMMNPSMMHSIGTMKEEDPRNCYISGGISSETSQQTIYESFASLDDNNLEDCFGLDIETAAAAEQAEELPPTNSLKMTNRESFVLPTTPRTSSTSIQALLESPPSPSVSIANTTATSSSSSSSSTTAATTGTNSPKPKRPLSAYNLFFQLERERLIAGTSHTAFTAEDVERVAIARRIADRECAADKPKRKHRKSHGMITFAELARTIANKWKLLEPHAKDLLQERAGLEKARFLRELEEWTKQNESDKNKQQDFEEGTASSEESDAEFTPQIEIGNLRNNVEPFASFITPRRSGDEEQTAYSAARSQVDMHGMSSRRPISSMWHNQHQQQEPATDWVSENESNYNNTNNDIERAKFENMRIVSPGNGSMYDNDTRTSAYNKLPRFASTMTTATQIPMGSSTDTRSNNCNIVCDSSLAASLMVADAFRMARRSGMDPSNILLMFQQMAVRERQHQNKKFHAEEEGGSNMMRQPLCPSPTFPPTRDSYSSSTALNSNDHYQQQRPPPPPLAKQQQYRTQQQEQQTYCLPPRRLAQCVVTRNPAATMKTQLDTTAEVSHPNRYEEEHQMSLLLASYEDDEFNMCMGEC